MGAHPGGLYAGDLPGRRLRRGLRLLGRRPRRDAGATTTTTGSGTGCSRSTTRRSTSRRLGDEPRSRSCGPRPSPTRGRSTRLRYPPDLDAPAEPVGARGDVGRAAPRRPGAGARRARGARRCRRREPRGVARRRPGAGAAGSDVQLTAEIGLWGYEPTPADPFVLNHRNFPRSTMLGDAAMVLGTLVGGPGTTTIALPRRRAGRPARQRQLDARSPTARSSSARAAATTSRASRPSASSSRRSRRSGRRPSAATSRHRAGRCARSSPTSARSRSSTARRRARCSPRCPRAPSRSPSESSARARPRAAGTSRSRADVRELAPPTRRRDRGSAAGTPEAGSSASG